MEIPATFIANRNNFCTFAVVKPLKQSSMRIINVKDFEGLYAVSDDGRVFNVRKGIEMKPRERSGYYYVTLKKDGQAKAFSVHELVYNSFNKRAGLWDKRRQYINAIDHINENKKDNRLENLQRVSVRENSARYAENHKDSGLPRGVNYFAQAGKYRARVVINRTRYFLGSYSSAEEAGKAYADAVKAYEEQGILPEKKDRTVKTCHLCGRTKPKSEFYYIQGHGTSWMCKECAKEYARQQRAKAKLNKENT